MGSIGRMGSWVLSVGQTEAAGDALLCLQNSNPCHGDCVYPDFDILKIVC